MSTRTDENRIGYNLATRIEDITAYPFYRLEMIRSDQAHLVTQYLRNRQLRNSATKRVSIVPEREREGRSEFILPGSRQGYERQSPLRPRRLDLPINRQQEREREGWGGEAGGPWMKE